MPSSYSPAGTITATPARTPRVGSSTVCAKLTTTFAGRKDVLVLSIDCPLVIGRNPAVCSYVIPDNTVSGTHCKIYAIQTSSGGIMVSLQDMSSNGLYVNGIRIRKTAILLMNGDTIQIASRRFECTHTMAATPQRVTVFDPTPQTDEVMKTKQINQYLLTSHCLGSGSFATVNLGMDSGSTSYKQVAVKIIKKKKNHKIEKMMKEVRILTALNHATINRVYDVHNDETFLYIFLQLCTGGDLFSYIVNHKDPASRLYEGETKYIMYQLILGLSYLHDKCISHRDLKPENILLFAPGPYPRIQIADFGLARRKSYEETFNVCGTVSYLPPEGIMALENRDMGYVGMPADCWSAGVLLYIMLSGHHPFDYGEISGESEYESEPLVLKSWEEKLSMTYIRNDRRVRRRIVDDDVEFAPDLWESLDDARTLCLGLLAFNPQQRWTIQDAFNSDWIQSDLEELSNVYLRRVGTEANNS